MRNIKFRAWGGYHAIGGSEEDKGEWVYWNPVNKPFPRPWKKWEGQFTGRVDKDANEIYEGDIILEELSPFELRENPNLKPKAIIAEIPRIYFEGWVNVSGKVVGNVYEHPHLLQ